MNDSMMVKKNDSTATSEQERCIKRAERARSAKREERRMARKIREQDFEDDDFDSE